MRRVHASLATTRAAALAVALATVLGAAARLSTVTWGAPFLFHPDERGFVMWEAASIEWRGLVRGDWMPRTTTYGPVIYELALALKWTFAGGIDEARRTALEYPDAWQYVNAGIDERAFSMVRWTHLVRGAVAFASSLAVLLLGLSAWRLAGPVAGAITAVLAAVSPGLVQASHYATTDSLLLFEIAMLLHAAALLARSRSAWPAVYAGLALGSMAATKMTGLLLLAVVPVAIAASGSDRGPLRSDRRSASHELARLFASVATVRFAIVVVLALGTYAALCPWAFVAREAYFDVPEHLSGMGVLRQQYQSTDYEFYDWRFPFRGTVPYRYVLTHVLPYATGSLVVLAGLAGWARGLARGATSARIALAAGLPTFLLVGAWGVKTIRYSLPMVPGLLLGAALVLARGAQRSRIGRAVALCALATAVARGAAFTAMFAEEDPRVLAARYLAEELRPGDVVVLDPEASYTAALDVRDQGVGVDSLTPEGVRIRRLWQTRPTDVRHHVDEALRDARFVVVGELYRRRGTHPHATRRAPDQARFYDALFAGETGFVLVRTFEREPRLGPLRWDESDAEPFAVAFDHMPVYVFERRGEYASPFAR